MSLFSTPPTARMVDETTPVPSVEIVGRTDATRTMKVVEYFGKRSVDVVEEPVPLITNPKDAIVR